MNLRNCGLVLSDNLRTGPYTMFHIYQHEYHVNLKSPFSMIIIIKLESSIFQLERPIPLPIENIIYEVLKDKY